MIEYISTEPLPWGMVCISPDPDRLQRVANAIYDARNQDDGQNMKMATAACAAAYKPVFVPYRPRDWWV